MSLPTYEEIQYGHNKLALVIPYLDGIDLTTASFVSHEWHNTFGAELWSNPLKFIAEMYKPFSRTYSFLNRAWTYSSESRDLVQFLDFRPLTAIKSQNRKDYTMFEAIITSQWALRWMFQFQNLKFIAVQGLSSLGYDRSQSFIRNASPRILLFSLTDARHIHTEDFISESVLENIMYLDISYTGSTEQWLRVMKNAEFRNLRVLKLRGMRLTDSILPERMITSRNRLWSLDLSDNLLTDITMDILLRFCTASTYIADLEYKALLARTPDARIYEDPPVYLSSEAEADPSMWQFFKFVRPDSLDGFKKYLSQNAHLSSNTTEVLPVGDPLLFPSGLTHLYLSSNKFTSLGIQSLLKKNKRLQVLDVGTVRESDPSFPLTQAYASTNLIPLLNRHSATQLTSLRIDHSIITFIPTETPRSRSLNISSYTIEELRASELALKDVAFDASVLTFRPTHNYRLQDLTLTSVPTVSFGPIIKALTSFLTFCLEQEQVLERARASSGSAHYRKPPLLSGLRKLRLEFSVPRQKDASATAVSISGDKDADVFLKESESDFSFFGCDGAADSKMRPSPVKKNSTGGSSVSASTTLGRRGNTQEGVVALPSENEQEQPLNVVEELKKFRSKPGPKWSGMLELVMPF